MDNDNVGSAMASSQKEASKDSSAIVSMPRTGDEEASIGIIASQNEGRNAPAADFPPLFQAFLAEHNLQQKWQDFVTTNNQNSPGKQHFASDVIEPPTQKKMNLGHPLLGMLKADHLGKIATFMDQIEDAPVLAITDAYKGFQNIQDRMSITSNVQIKQPYKLLGASELAHVFSFLSIIEDGLVALPKTCKHFHKIVDWKFLVKHCQFYSSDDTTTSRSGLTVFFDYYRYSSLFRNLSDSAGHNMLCREVAARTSSLRPDALYWFFLHNTWNEITFETKAKAVGYGLKCWSQGGWATHKLQYSYIFLLSLMAERGEKQLFHVVLKYVLPRWHTIEAYGKTQALKVLKDAILLHNTESLEMLFYHTTFWTTLCSRWEEVKQTDCGRLCAALVEPIANNEVKRVLELLHDFNLRIDFNSALEDLDGVGWADGLL